MAEGTATHDEHAHEHHIVSVGSYALVLLGLGILMVLTVVASLFHFGDLINPMLALVIAVSKAVLIVLIFMNVYFSTRLTKIFVAGAFFWLIFLFGLIIIDFLSRRLVTTPEPWN